MSCRWLSQIQRGCLSCQSPVVSSRSVFLGKVAFDVVGLGVDPPCLRVDSEETLPALIEERAEMNYTVPGITPDGGSLEGTPVLEPLEHSGLEMFSHDKHMMEAPVLEPLEHSVLEKPLDGGSLERRPIVDWFVRFVMELLEHSVMATAAVWEPLEHLDCGVTDHVDIDSFWKAPWDASGTIGDSCRSCVTFWETAFRSVVRLSCCPVFVDVDCALLFGSFGQLCVLDMHEGYTDAPTRRAGDDPQRKFPLPPLSPGDGGLMGKSSRQSSITGIGHSLAMCFPRRDATPGEIGKVEDGRRTVWGFSNIDFATGEYGTVELVFAGQNFRRPSAARKNMTI